MSCLEQFIFEFNVTAYAFHLSDDKFSLCFV